MNNHLANGTVLPHGLLGINVEASMGAFNKAYKNTPLRMGIVVTSYAYNDPNNYTKLATEYDVLVLEQNENISCTNIKYRNCISSEGMGSVADYFEKNLRTQTENENANGEINTSGQNGAIVILLCLDAFTQKAVIISGLTHPDRQTKLTDTDPKLSGEYNGVNVEINTDGSTALVFNGATDNNGDPVDPTQGTTTVEIEKDGTFKIDNESTSLEMNKTSGDILATTMEGMLVLKASLAELKLDQGKVALGGPTAELLDLFDQTLTQLITLTTSMTTETHLGNLGYPTSVPLNAASYLAVMQSLTMIQTLLITIKGSL